MPKIGLVACSSRKLLTASTASELYSSDLFQKARAYVEKTCDSWFILSAKHGLLKPKTVLEPYNLTLNKMPVKERRAWADGVWLALKNELHQGDSLVILAGKRYQEFLLPYLKTYTIELPLEHLGIGKQLHWLKEHTHEQSQQ